MSDACCGKTIDVRALHTRNAWSEFRLQHRTA